MIKVEARWVARNANDLMASNQCVLHDQTTDFATGAIDDNRLLSIVVRSGHNTA